MISRIVGGKKLKIHWKLGISHLNFYWWKLPARHSLGEGGGI